MYERDRWFTDLIKSEPSDHLSLLLGDLLLGRTVPASLISFVSLNNCSIKSCHFGKKVGFVKFRRGNGIREPLFSSVSLSIKESDEGEGYVGESGERLGQDGDKKLLEEDAMLGEQKVEAAKVKERGSGALNTTKHLWAGAVAAIVSRTFIAPLERMKLEYIVRGEQRNLFELVKKIAASEGLKGFWKGNFLNILRTAPFKAINFYAYDTYRSQLLKLSGNEETTNFERFVAGAAAGITASLLCLPMDTI